VSKPFATLIRFHKGMRLNSRLAAALALLAWGYAGAPANAGSGIRSAERALTTVLNTGMRAAGPSSGAYVLDLTTGRILFSDQARIGRHPGSVEKIYTTSAALLDFGPNASLTTSVLGVGRMRGATFRGTLYLRGGGDPTFGSTDYDRALFGTGATVQRLVTHLLATTKMRSFAGNVVADESIFDSLRGTPPTGYAPSFYIEGELSALSFDRDWVDSSGTAYFPRPALEAGQQFVAALVAAGVRMRAGTHVSTGVTPSAAQPLALVHSPRIAKLVSLTNTPSDTFFAETLLKDLGARFGHRGSTAGGVTVVRTTLARRFGVHPRFDDGSGIARFDHTTPYDVVSLLRQQAHNAPFTRSLAIAGETGTLRHEMIGTYAQGRCRGKSGTLYDASNVVGYCHARDGHTLAYAFLLNRIVPSYAHPIQNQMQVALAEYDG
jgi:serine-type D-Ala-D-Ala carboxypeptidase/endopeptidase (penicillin-binding protein 4)